MEKPLTLVIFGATGDLYQNKLASTLYNLFSLGFLPKEWKVIGFGRRQLGDAEFREYTKTAVLTVLKGKAAEPEKIDDFLKHMEYLEGNLEDQKSFEDVGARLAKRDEKIGICSDKIFYLATPPHLYGEIFKNISHAGLTIPCAPGAEDTRQAWTRVLVEKPFGKDIKDAEQLDKLLGELFDESQVFRIDHYLAKEAFSDIISFRFDGGTLEEKWNSKYIERVRIVFHERSTAASRGALYDGLGAFRDVGENHMLQMLALAAMEDPGKLYGTSFHKAREAILKKIFLNKSREILRGQYEGYRNEPGVKPGSETETFFRIHLGIDSDRWRGVDFELEAGKALDKAEVRIEVCFKKEKKCYVFPISGGTAVPYDAYEKVLHHSITGEQTFFTTTEEVMAEWRVVEEVVSAWQSKPLVIYKTGSSGESIH